MKCQALCQSQEECKSWMFYRHKFFPRCFTYNSLPIGQGSGYYTGGLKYNCTTPPTPTTTTTTTTKNKATTSAKCKNFILNIKNLA